mmetsp:Transcript_18735/g.54092  ORF Transcript_18735/g.54092 Transcript_18735/m.54092 type:complete len:109 (-) Transcript_18735:1097-1423(-)
MCPYELRYQERSVLEFVRCRPWRAGDQQTVLLIKDYTILIQMKSDEALPLVIPLELCVYPFSPVLPSRLARASASRVPPNAEKRPDIAATLPVFRLPPSSPGIVSRLI